MALITNDTYYDHYEDRRQRLLLLNYFMLSASHNATIRLYKQFPVLFELTGCLLLESPLY